MQFLLAAKVIRPHRLHPLVPLPWCSIYDIFKLEFVFRPRVPSITSPLPQRIIVPRFRDYCFLKVLQGRRGDM
jgi:hypothetical protein